VKIGWQIDMKSNKDKPLNYRQLRAIEALNSRTPGETLQDVANRASISRAQLYRYMNDPKFRAAIPERLRSEQLYAIIPVFQALVKAAISGDVGAQREFWRLCGFQDSTTVNISGFFSQIQGTNNQQATIDPEKLSEDERAALLAIARKVAPGGNHGNNGNGATYDLDASSIKRLPSGDEKLDAVLNIADVALLNLQTKTQSPQVESRSRGPALSPFCERKETDQSKEAAVTKTVEY
jgi:hypothetical protein